jgi:hypothetical protein
MTLGAIHYWVVRAHVVPGVVAMVVGPAAMIASKGGWWHRLWGRIFVWSVILALVPGLPLAIEANDYFLFFMTLVIFHLTVSGYRIHIIKRQNYRGGLIDWIGVALMVLAGVVATSLGLSTHWGDEMGSVMLIVGLGVMIGGAKDFYRLVRSPRDKQAWLFIHMERMLCAYLSALSAVSVVQFHWLPTTARWLWPMAIGIPGMIVWTRYYRNQFRRSEGRFTVGAVAGPVAGP